jgi:phosphate:Na+ symporter
MGNMIDGTIEEMRQDNISRLRNGECSLDPGLVFIDLLSIFEKIGDYCFNIAQAVVGIK